MTSSSALVLDGVTVVSIEQAIAAPFATRQLADLGARVIKVERTGQGDFARQYDDAVNGLLSHFVWCNRSKESIALDIKSDEGRRVLRALIRGADVFVQNLGPGACQRLGLGADALRRSDPRLIVCDISGYGSGGPGAGRRAYDLLIQCETGMVSVTGDEDRPAKVGVSIADIATGMYAFSGILTALLNRERTGQGTHIRVAMLDALGEWMQQPAYVGKYRGVEVARAGSTHSGIAPYGPFECRDGQTIFIAVQNDAEWRRLCSGLLGDEHLGSAGEFSGNGARVRNRAAVDALVQRAVAAWDRPPLIQALDELGIANAAMRMAGSLWEHPDVVGRDRTTKVSAGDGVIEALLPPVTAEGFGYVMGRVPDLGEHTRAILGEMGYQPPEVEALSERGLVGTAEERGR